MCFFSSAVVPFPTKLYLPLPNPTAALSDKTLAKHVPNSETILCVIASYSAIHCLAGLMCGPSVAGCGGEIGCSDRAQD